jgi:ABC-type cobalamin transport system ATPase subunit
VVLLAGGAVVAEGAAAEVLARPECALAFGVSIRGHAVPGVPHPLYSFDESGHAR